MKARVKEGRLKGHVFEVVEVKDGLKIFELNEADKITELQIIDEELLLKKENCVIYNSMGLEIKPCKVCGRLDRSNTCTQCSEAIDGVNHLLKFSNGRIFIKGKLS